MFEFLTMKNGGGKNYAFAKAYVPTFEAFREPETAADKNDLYNKICEQITHLSFNRVATKERFGPTLRCPRRLRCCCPR